MGHNKEIHEESVSVIIPTKDREVSLYRLLKSLSAQREDILEVVVVDSSANSGIEELISKYKKRSGMQLHYVKARGGSSTKRNVGVRIGKGTAYLFLDDDVVLDRECIREVKRVLMSTRDKKIGGIQAGVNLQFKKRSAISRDYLFERLFLIRKSSGQHKFLRSGFCAGSWNMPEEIETTYDEEWLFGGCTAYRSELFHKLNLLFSSELEKFGEYAYMEDAHFSGMVKKAGYQLVRTRKARFWHLCESDSDPDDRSFEAMKTFHHYVIWRDCIKHDVFAFLALVWCNFGLLLKNIGLLLVKRNRAKLYGFFDGIRATFTDILG